MQVHVHVYALLVMKLTKKHIALPCIYNLAIPSAA